MAALVVSTILSVLTFGLKHYRDKSKHLLRELKIEKKRASNQARQHQTVNKIQAEARKKRREAIDDGSYVDFFPDGVHDKDRVRKGSEADS